MRMGKGGQLNRLSAFFMIDAELLKVRRMPDMVVMHFFCCRCSVGTFAIILET